MKRSSKEIFLKNLHSKTYANAFEAFLFSMGSTQLLWQNLSRVNEGEFDNERRRVRSCFYTMSSRLKKDGLIKDDLTLTCKGIDFVNSFLNKSHYVKKLPPCSYEHTSDKTFILVIFDIPEKLRRYRAWLRNVLKSLDFTLLQKSVWMGEEKLPNQFLKDIHEMRIIRYIQILQISKRGTVEFIVRTKK